MATPRRRIPGLEHGFASIVMIEQTDRVAHYSRLEHVANILHDKKLLIGPVYNCADPREASMGWLDTEGIGYGPDSDKQRTAKEMICRVGRQVRLLCTMASSEPVSQASCSIEESIYCRPRMWAQYGDQSRGFCVVLNREALNNRLLQVVERDDYLISAKVKYFPWLEMVGGDTTIPYGPEQDPRDIDIFELMNENGMLQSIYFKKSIDWKEECEYRWLVFARTEKPVYVSIENSIEAVVLGSHFPLNQVSQVKAYCREIDCRCFCVQYLHPKYQLLRIY